MKQCSRCKKEKDESCYDIVKGRVLTICKECRNKRTCEHGKNKNVCFECTPEAYCFCQGKKKRKICCPTCSPHMFCLCAGEMRRKYDCFKCNPSAFCQCLGKFTEKRNCPECNPNTFCECTGVLKRKSNCICNDNRYCYCRGKRQHKYNCYICHPEKFCMCNNGEPRRKDFCSFCSPKTLCVDCGNGRIHSKIENICRNCFIKREVADKTQIESEEKKWRAEIKDKLDEDEHSNITSHIVSKELNTILFDVGSHNIFGEYVREQSKNSEELFIALDCRSLVILRFSSEQSDYEGRIAKFINRLKYYIHNAPEEYMIEETF